MNDICALRNSGGEEGEKGEQGLGRQGGGSTIEVGSRKFGLSRNGRRSRISQKVERIVR